MRSLVIWNAVVAAVLGGVFGALLHLMLGRGGAGRTAFKTIGIILLTGATTPGCRRRTPIFFAAR